MIPMSVPLVSCLLSRMFCRRCQDGAEEAGTTVNGGQTILNPWMTVGGAATSICQPNEYIM